MVAEYDGGYRLTAVFKTDVISRMRRELGVFKTGLQAVLADNSIYLNRSAIKAV